MAKISAFALGILCLLFSIFFICYGIKGGLIEQKILSDFFNNYITGKEAVQRGIFYIIIGLFFLIGAIIVMVSLYMKKSQGI